MKTNIFKSLLTTDNIKSGAKKAIITTSIIGMLLSATTSVVYASVPAENILGEEQVQEDQTRVKIKDYLDIYKKFYGFDKTGINTLNISDISKAIELSNVLNNYFFDPVIYTNTTKNEVLNLDIAKMYKDYKAATEDYEFNDVEFCEENLTNKPAIDAYITFSCGAMSNFLKAKISNVVFDIKQSEGYKMTYSSKGIINNNDFYVLLEIEGKTQIIKLTGDSISDIINQCKSLDYHYYTALYNIAGYSSDYENTFAYNGIEKDTQESVWLSFPNSDIKEELTTAINTYKDILEDKYEFVSSYPEQTFPLTEEEKNMLRSLDYDEASIEKATSSEMSLRQVQNKKLTK